MKKLLLICAIVAVASTTTILSLKKIHQMPELLRANINALSENEGDGYNRNEYGCIIWEEAICYAVIVTPDGNYPLDIEDSRN